MSPKSPVERSAANILWSTDSARPNVGETACQSSREPLGVDGADLVQHHMTGATLKPTSNTKRIHMRACSQKRHDEGSRVRVQLLG